MNIPLLPTDNLYKFLAIFGLIILVFSFYLEDRHLEELHNINKRMREFNIDHQGDKEFRDYLKSSMDSMLNYQKSVYNKTYALLQDSKKRPVKLDELESLKIEIENIKDLPEDIKRISDKWIDLNDAWLISAREAEKNLGDSDYVEKKAKYARFYAKYLRVIGSLSMVFGFILWYWKHQRYIDAKIKWEGQKLIALLKEEEEK